ncbi:hypothetical protein HZH66_005861 [Vespula vulgaris]|uniref:Uncharacterized protein n=1 Tax=Vespula vulgaris TaxID=7454 RepID=A0A834K787_VESVU|nr:hypothetical protein HZH66_005861 [Vespula vulgaris]
MLDVIARGAIKCIAKLCEDFMTKKTTTSYRCNERRFLGEFGERGDSSNSKLKYPYWILLYILSVFYGHDISLIVGDSEVKALDLSIQRLGDLRKDDISGIKEALTNSAQHLNQMDLFSVIFVRLSKEMKSSDLDGYYKSICERESVNGIIGLLKIQSYDANDDNSNNSNSNNKDDKHNINNFYSIDTTAPDIFSWSIK